MDKDRKNRGGGEEVLKPIGIFTAIYLIVAITVSFLRGTLQANLPYIAMTGLILTPLTVWAGLIAKKYLFPT